MNDPRDEYIGKVVKDKTFADAGGLWGVVNEKVSVAHRYGASTLTMIDRVGPKDELWRLFEERRQHLGVPEVSCIVSDILALADLSPCPQFDVVHCSGVLYHIPDPLRLLTTLRKITREYLVLGSIVSGTKIESDQGILEIPNATALFVPALQGRERAIVQSYWQKLVGDGAVGLTQETPWQLDNYVPWWWLPTVEALKAMCESAGFHYVEGSPFWNGNAHVLLLSVHANKTDGAAY